MLSSSCLGLLRICVCMCACARVCMDEREKRRRLAGSRQREEKINLYRVVAKRLSLNLAIRDANNSNVPRINRSLEALLRPRNEFKTVLLILSSFLPLFSILFCILSSFKYSINLHVGFDNLLSPCEISLFR